MVVEWLGFNHEVRDIVVMKKIVIRFSSVFCRWLFCVLDSFVLKGRQYFLQNCGSILCYFKEKLSAF